MNYLKLKLCSAIGLGILTVSLNAQAFNEKNIESSVACFPGIPSCTWNLDVPESDAIASFHLKIKGDPKTVDLISVMPDTWTTGNEPGGVFAQGSVNRFGDLRFTVKNIKKSDIVSWSYDYFDDDGKTIITTSIPEPETYGMMLVGLGFLGFINKPRKIS